MVKYFPACQSKHLLNRPAQYGDIPPAEFEMAHYRQLEESADAA
jgi:hypothetical protein